MKYEGTLAKRCVPENIVGWTAFPESKKGADRRGQKGSKPNQWTMRINHP